MARRYTRDNRGRFASAGGGGATARGGRLRTASGKKRATQTMKAAGAGGAGVMKGKPTGKAATVSREQFVARQGSRADSMVTAIAAASPGGRARMSKKQEGRMVATADRQRAAARAKDEKAGNMYDSLAKAGKVKSPKAESRIARLTRAAQGDPNTERARAAQRLLAKRAGAAKPRPAKPAAMAKRSSPAMPKRNYVSMADIDKKRARVSSGDMFRQRASGSKAKRANTQKTLAKAAAVYGVQRTLQNTGRLTKQIVRKGVPFPDRLR
jgi:hypothetical protein